MKPSAIRRLAFFPLFAVALAGCTSLPVDQPYPQRSEGVNQAYPEPSQAVRPGGQPARANGTAPLASEKEWGVYAGLAGSSWSGGDWRITVEWREVGVELVETWDGARGAEKMTNVITRGDRPGELRMASTVGRCAKRTGAVRPDGSVLFRCDGFFKWPTQVAWPKSGVLEHRWVEMSGEEIASVKRTLRFQTESGATRVASAPAGQAPSGAAASKLSDSAEIRGGNPPAKQAAARPVADWSPWMPLANSKVWKREGEDGWKEAVRLREFSWHEGASPRMEMRIINEFRRQFFTGEMEIEASAGPIIKMSSRRRFIYALESQGSLLETEQILPIFGEKKWETRSSARYWPFLPDGERWGVLRDLAGYSWYHSKVPARPKGSLFGLYKDCLTFSWSPKDQVAETTWNWDNRLEEPVSIHTPGREQGVLEGYLVKADGQTKPLNMRIDDKQMIVPDFRHENIRDVFRLDAPNVLTKLRQKLENGRWETFSTETFTRETEEQKRGRILYILDRAAEQRSRKRYEALGRFNDVTSQVLNGVRPVVGEYLEQSRRQQAQSLEQARQMAAARAAAEREEAERKYQADWRHAKQVLAEQEKAREARAEASRAEADRRQHSVAQSAQQQEQRRAEDARRREAAEAERKRKQEADAERSRREEIARRERAEREALARSKQLEDALKRQEEEARNRPVAYREGITLCAPPKNGGKAWLCKGPLQNVSGVLDTQSGNVAVRQACGGNNFRDLGMVAGYRAYGCGFGIHPTDREYPGNRDIPASLGVNYVPDRGVFHCNPSKVFAYCKDRR